VTEPVILRCGPDGTQRAILRRQGLGRRAWWWIADPRTGEALSGGFATRSEALAEVRRLESEDTP
jgi:hypothetical protein